MIQDELKRCHQLVWQRRAELEDVWPTPDTADALRFAFTEAGEAMDAWLRLNGEYARNNEKDLSVEDELADCAMMLLTALRDGGTRDIKPILVADIDRLMGICEGVTRAMVKHQIYPMGRWYIDCGFTVGRIANYPEIDLHNRIAARLDRIEKKQRGCDAKILDGNAEALGEILEGLSDG